MNNYINRIQKSKYVRSIAKSITLVTLIFFIITSFLGSNENYGEKVYRISDYIENSLGMIFIDNNLNIYIPYSGENDFLYMKIYDKSKKLVQDIKFPIKLEDIFGETSPKEFNNNLSSMMFNITLFGGKISFVNFSYLFQIDNDKIQVFDNKNFNLKKLPNNFLDTEYLGLENNYYNTYFAFDKFLYINDIYFFYVFENNFFDFENTWFSRIEYKNVNKSGSINISKEIFDKDSFKKLLKEFPAYLDSKSNLISGFDYISVNKELEKYNYEVLDKEIEIFRGCTRTMMYIDANDNLWYSFDIIKKGNRKFDLNTYTYDKSYITDSRSCFAKFEKDKTGKYVLTGIYGPFNVSELDNWRIYCDDICFVKDGKIYASIRKSIFEPAIEGKASKHELRKYQREIWEIKVE
jgi:hypothetical protein